MVEICSFYVNTPTHIKHSKKEKHRREEPVYEEAGGDNAIASRASLLTDTDTKQTSEGPNLLNPLLARLYRKFIRFLTFRRVADILMILGIAILAYDGLELLYFNPGQSMSNAGDYSLNDDILSWLQALAVVTGIWYCWIPVRGITIVLGGKDVPESLRSFDTSTIQAGGFIDSQFASQDKTTEYDSYNK